MIFKLTVNSMGDGVKGNEALLGGGVKGRGFNGFGDLVGNGLEGVFR